MTKQKRARLIRKYGAGYDKVVRALEGFPPRKLTARPFRGKWTAAEIVHHLADSEMISAIRLRHLLAEDKPVIHAYDQAVFAARLRYNERELAPALEAFRAARSTSVQLLKRMTAGEWARRAWHTEGGPYDPELWLEIYAVHAHNHAKQIVRLRAAVTARRGATRRKGRFRR